MLNTGIRGSRHKALRGAYIASLYFVNDHSYYEPNRHYTVSVTDDGDRLLGVTEVESFGGGVHKRLAVRGPQSLTLRIWRDLSINTLLAGVFLDAIDTPTSSPCAAHISNSANADRPIEQYDRLRASFAETPLEASADVETIQRLAGRIESARASAHGHGLATLDWMLAECLGLRGHHRRADAAFDLYLNDLASAVPEADLAATYGAVGEELIARAGEGRELNAALIPRRGRP